MKKVERSDLKKSDYIRKALLETPIIKIDNLKDIYVELKKQGNNLNQLTKAVNQGKVESINFSELKDLYDKLNENIREIIKEL